MAIPCVEGRCPFVNSLDQRIVALEEGDKEIRMAMEAGRLETKGDVKGLQGKLDKILYLLVSILITAIGTLVSVMK